MESAKHAEAGGLIGSSRHQTSTFVSMQRYGKNMKKRDQIGRYQTHARFNWTDVGGISVRHARGCILKGRSVDVI